MGSLWLQRQFARRLPLDVLALHGGQVLGQALRAGRGRGCMAVARSAAASGDALGDVAADVEVELDGQVGLVECLPGMAESF